MDANRGSFRAITTLIFICLSLRLDLVSGKPFKSSNRTGGYTPVVQNLRTITVGRNALHAFNERNTNNQNSINLTKVSAKSDVNSGSDIYSESMRSDSRGSDWSLQFDPNYFESLNAANHRPIDPMISSPTDSQSKISSTSSSSGDNMYYYSPETYGKTNHKNHKTNSFAYLYPSSSTTTTTTTSTSTTPSPKISHNRIGESSGVSSQTGYSERGPPYDQPYNSNDKHSSVNYNYEETPEEEEEPAYYDANEEIGRKYYYPTRNRPKHYPIPDYYGSDLSSMPTNENLKIKSAVNSPVPSYGAQEETDIGQDISTYESGGNVRFPSKYYGGGGSAYSHYPSYYSSQYPLASEHSHSISDSLLHRSSSWLGPGLAGVLLGLGLPLGIIMASMLPTIMSVAPIVSTATVGRRKRFIPDFDLLSFNNTQMILNSGVLEILSKYGMSSLEDPKCLTEMFCTFASEGRNSKKNLIQNIIYHLIDLTPNQWAKWLSVDTLFNAVKHNKCEPTFNCMSKKVKFKDTDRYN